MSIWNKRKERSKYLRVQKLIRKAIKVSDSSLVLYFDCLSVKNYLLDLSIYDYIIISSISTNNLCAESWSKLLFKKNTNHTAKDKLFQVDVNIKIITKKQEIN